ncbi:hypothetical protein PQX77_001777 [Marasmius sp. AFHP31]|nr:hypothetical protein PQX77_001777 [Marasmius sp. AFHP31]
MPLHTNTVLELRFKSPKPASVTQSPKVKLPETLENERGYSARRFVLDLRGHICPKRLGDYQARILFVDFVGPPPPGLTIFDPMFGLLTPNEDRWFDSFNLGFWHDPSEPGYHLIVHDFTANQNVSVAGLKRTPHLNPALSSVPLLHRYPVSPPFLHHTSLPPLGLFRWHYLQCIIRKFKTDALENVPNISHFELPFRTEDDDDDSGTDSDFEWPSAVFDRGRSSVQEEEEGSKLDGEYQKLDRATRAIFGRHSQTHFTHVTIACWTFLS